MLYLRTGYIHFKNALSGPLFSCAHFKAGKFIHLSVVFFFFPLLVNSKETLLNPERRKVALLCPFLPFPPNTQQPSLLTHF